MELKDIEQKLSGFEADTAKAIKDLGDALKQRVSEVEAKGGVDPETKEKIDRLFTRIDQVEAQMTRPGAPTHPEGKSFGEQLTTSARFVEAQKANFRADRVMRFPMEGSLRQLKAQITDAALGNATSGVINLQRLPGITGIPQQALRIRDLMTVRQLTAGNSFDWVKQATRTNAPSPQVEGSPKAESTYTWTVASGTVQTIAHFTNVSRQALDDVAWLRGQIDSELMYGLKLKEESEILAGDGLGIHLSGLITQATAYDTALNESGDTKLDKLRHAKLQARLAGLATFGPEAIVLHPEDMHDIELIKTEEGAANKGVYVVGDPKTGTEIKFVWGLPVVESDSMDSGQFLVGAFRSAAELIDRMDATLLISFEHDVNFTSNMATILCEERIGLAVRRPDAFIVGSF